MSLLEYSDVEDAARDAEESSLLLGNGFSIALDPRFAYSSLFEQAKKSGMRDSALGLFERVGGPDFEAVLRLLDDGKWTAERYWKEQVDLAELNADHEAVRNALVAAIKDSHLEHAGQLDDASKRGAAAFLAPYQSVFTTSYDLLLYWVAMSSENARLDDGFRTAGSPTFVGWDEDSRKMMHLHGALHFYRSEDGLKKHSWNAGGRPLKELVANGIQEGQYPHFVSEGYSTGKLGKIRSSPYLYACYRRLEACGPLVVSLGFSFAENDEHVSTALLRNPKVRQLYVGLHGEEESASNLAIKSRLEHARGQRRAELEPVTVSYFDSGSAHVWTGPEEA